MTDRLAIGGNSPPASAAFALHIQEMFDTANGVTTIETEDQAAVVDELLAQIKQAKKDGDATRATEKAPHLAACKAVDDEWRTPLRQADIAADALKARLTPWRLAQQAKRDAEAKQARDDAEAALRAAQADLQSDDLDTVLDAEQALKAAGKLSAAANRMDRAATGLRTTTIADVTDRRALLEHVMRTDPDGLTEWLQEYARKALPAKLPGVTIRVERVAI